MLRTMSMEVARGLAMPVSSQPTTWGRGRLSGIPSITASASMPPTPAGTGDSLGILTHGFSPKTQPALHMAPKHPAHYNNTLLLCSHKWRHCPISTKDTARNAEVPLNNCTSKIKSSKTIAQVRHHSQLENILYLKLIFCEKRNLPAKFCCTSSTYLSISCFLVVFSLNYKEWLLKGKKCYSRLLVDKKTIQNNNSRQSVMPEIQSGQQCF